MKKLLYFSVVVALIALPRITLAATATANEGTYDRQDIGTLTAWGDTSDDVETFLETEAFHNGASTFMIKTESSVDGQVYGKETLYK